jgi:rubrerythrin
MLPAFKEFEMHSCSKKGAKKWLCEMCGYLHTGDEPPAVCPVCGAGPEKFKPLETPTLD